MSAVWRHLGAPTFIADITAYVEKDRRETRSGSWVDDQINSSTLDKDLKLSKKLARWWRQLKGKEMKKEQVFTSKAFVTFFAVVSSPS